MHAGVDFGMVSDRLRHAEKRVDLGSPAFLAPIAMGDTLYVVTDKAQLIALR